VGYISEPDFERLMAVAEEVSRVLGALRASVERTKNGLARQVRDSALSTQYSALEEPDGDSQ